MTTRSSQASTNGENTKEDEGKVKMTQAKGKAIRTPNKNSFSYNPTPKYIRGEDRKVTHEVIVF